MPFPYVFSVDSLNDCLILSSFFIPDLSHNVRTVSVAQQHIFVRSPTFPDVFVPMFEENMGKRYT